MHAGIFWGFVLLTIGTANIVTGGIIQAVLSIPLDGAAVGARSARCRTSSRSSSSSRSAGRSAGGWSRGRARLTFNRDALLILGDDRRRRRDRAARAGRSRSPRTATIPGAFVSNALAVPLRAPVAGGARGRRSRSCGGRHIALVAAFLCYLPFSKHLHIATSFPNICFRKLAPRGELPTMDLEAEDATFGLKTLQDLGWKDLLDGFTCTECGRCQEACPAWNTGKPLNPKTFIMGIRDMSVEAEHGIDLIPNSPIVRETYGLEDTQAARGGAGQPDRRRRDPVRRGLGLRDLRRVRRGLPGAHRARRQDRRAAPEPRPRGVAASRPS